MKTVRVESFRELHEELDNCLGNRLWLFRGQGNLAWPLVPKFGRPQFHNVDWRDFFSSFKRRASEFVQGHITSDWDWMAIAQHHGLPTKLLDWSYNPLVAAYFAAHPLINEDCVIYAYLANNYIDPDKSAPDECAAGCKRLRPRGVAGRIIRQSGIFTFHNPAEKDLATSINHGESLHQIIITAKYRPRLIAELDFYGINAANLFPDLDGLAAYQTWSAHVDTRKIWGGLRHGTRRR